MTIIDKAKCIGCGMCVKECFTTAMQIADNKAVFCTDKPCMECGHCMAVCPQNAITIENYPMDQVIEADSCESAIDPQVYLNHLKLRRSIRAFKDEPITREQLEMILEAGRFSPTGGNEQTVSYHIFQEKLPEFREMLLNQLKIQGEKALAEGNTSSWYPRTWLRLYNAFKEKGEDQLFFNCGAVIAVASQSPQDALIAAAHMETMIYSMGLGMLYSGFSNRAINASKDIQKYMQIRDDYTCWAVLIVGHPDVTFRRSVPRKAADAVWF